MSTTTSTPKPAPKTAPKTGRRFVHRAVPTAPPGVVNAAVDSLFSGYETLVSSATDYWTSALARGATPADLVVDVLDWAAAVADRKPPQWASEREVLAEWPVARLLDFPHPDPGSTVAGALPVLFLPPQAGHDSCIVDYAPDQSQVRTAQAAGLGRVCAMDWKGATGRTRSAGIEEYVAVITEAVQLLGGRVHLVGDCQGGWLGTIYAALHPDSIASLTIAGAPVDYHAGEPLIHDWVRILSPRGELDLYRLMVAFNRGVLPGDYLLTGFKLLQPEAELDRLLQLFAHIHEPGWVQRFRTFENWFQHTQPLPGEFYLWIVEHLFQGNELIAGTLKVGGRAVDLGRITAPLFLIAGDGDHITPPPQVWALAEHAGTPEAKVTRVATSGGHLGLFMGHESLRTAWAPVLARIAALD